jgi:hypothetical protein
MYECRRKIFLVKKEFADKQPDAEAQARLDDTGTIRRYLRLADQVLQGDDKRDKRTEENQGTPAA